MTDAYGEDLAYIHDAGFGDFARRAGQALLPLMARRGIAGGLVVDLGSGSGIWARQLLDAGYRVLGIEISPAMIELARKRAPEAEFRRDSLFDADLPPCAAVTSIGECLNYLFDPRGGPAALKRLFARIFAALAPGGLFIFDVVEPSRLRHVPRHFREGPDWACLVEYETDDRTGRHTRRIITFRKLGELYRRAEETHVQQLYRAAELAAELRRIGFRVRLARGYGELRFQKGHAAIIARKA